MIPIDRIREDSTATAEALAKRGVVPKDVEKLEHLDLEWLEVTKRVEALRAKQNAANATVAAASAADKKKHIEALQDLSQQLKKQEEELATAAAERQAAWQALPNIPLPDVPPGGEDNNQVINDAQAAPPEFNFKTRSYLELAGDTINLDAARRVSGSRFTYLTGKLARLQLGLVSFIFDTLAEHNFTPVVPPVLVGSKAMAGMGYLGTHADEVYQVQDDLFLTGTSEQAIGPMYMGQRLTSEELPLRFVGYSSCFRREAGSHGKDVKGILRLHQFEKIEMFSFADPKESENEHLFLLERQRTIMEHLELPYRVVLLAAGDLGGSAAKTYDLETWIPSEQTYRETHSASNTTDYQSRRLNIKLAGTSGQRPHLLNATAAAIGRIVIALLENHQQADGSVRIPDALHSYVPFTTFNETTR